MGITRFFKGIFANEKNEDSKKEEKIAIVDSVRKILDDKEMSEFDKPEAISKVIKNNEINDDERLTLLQILAHEVTVGGSIIIIELICGIKDDSQKIKLLSAVNGKVMRATICKTLTDPDAKLLFNFDNDLSCGIMALYQEDDPIRKELEVAARLISHMFLEHELRLLGVERNNLAEAIESAQTESLKVALMVNLPGDNEKLRLISKLQTECGKSYAIASLENEEMKLELLKGINDECNRTRIISSLKENSELKEELLKEIKGKDNRVSIITSFENNETKDRLIKNLISQTIDGNDFSIDIDKLIGLLNQQHTRDDELINSIRGANNVQHNDCARVDDRRKSKVESFER